MIIVIDLFLFGINKSNFFVKKIILMKSKSLVALVMGLLIFTSCSDSKDRDDDVATAGEIKTHQFLDARSYANWVYFSFSRNEIVAVDDAQNDANWDIAFHRGDVKLNGGKSGKGSSEAINTAKTEWNAVTSAPTSGYAKDEIGTITTAFTGAGVTEEDQPFSQIVSTWLTVDTSTPPPKYTVHNYVYVLRSASGKYVKLQLYDNKSATNAAGYVSFKYQYNAGGGSAF